MVAFFFVKNLTSSRLQIFRFLAALCAGFAGYLLAGEALFSMTAQSAQGTSIIVRGTAGFALFFVVWYGFRQALDVPPPPPSDGFNFSVPNGWTFGGTVEAIARQDNALVTFDGFS